MTSGGARGPSTLLAWVGVFQPALTRPGLDRPSSPLRPTAGRRDRPDRGSRSPCPGRRTGLRDDAGGRASSPRGIPSLLLPSHLSLRHGPALVRPHGGGVREGRSPRPHRGGRHAGPEEGPTCPRDRLRNSSSASHASAAVGRTDLRQHLARLGSTRTPSPVRRGTDDDKQGCLLSVAPAVTWTLSPQANPHRLAPSFSPPASSQVRSDPRNCGAHPVRMLPSPSAQNLADPLKPTTEDRQVG